MHDMTRQKLEDLIGALVAIDSELSERELLGEVRYARRQLERLELYAVADYRLSGASWQNVADQLVMTRQGAHQKFGPRGVDDLPYDLLA